MVMKFSPLVKAKPKLPEATAPHYTGHRQRLKEKFHLSGDQALHDYELLELLLFCGIPRADVKPIAKNLLAKFGSLLGVFGASPQALKEVNGVGDAAIHVIKLVYSLMGRSMQENLQGKWYCKAGIR